MAMSILRQKKEEDLVAAVTAVMETPIFRELAIHPTIKNGCGRDIRDAYFYGLVFAVVDGGDMNRGGRMYLNDAAKSLGVDALEVDEAVALISKMSANDKFKLLEEGVRSIATNELIVKCFYVQLEEVRARFGCLSTLYGQCMEMIKVWSGIEFAEKLRKSVEILFVGKGEESKTTFWGAGGLAIPAIETLVGWMGEDAVRRCALRRYGDIAPRIKRDERSKATAEIELHKLQEELSVECFEWRTCRHLGDWWSTIARRMYPLSVELIDIEYERSRVLALCKWDKKCWHTFERRKYIGMMIVLGICGKLQDLLKDGHARMDIDVDDYDYDYNFFSTTDRYSSFDCCNRTISSDYFDLNKDSFVKDVKNLFGKRFWDEYYYGED